MIEEEDAILVQNQRNVLEYTIRHEVVELFFNN